MDEYGGYRGRIITDRTNAIGRAVAQQRLGTEVKRAQDGGGVSGLQHLYARLVRLHLWPARSGRVAAQSR